MSILESIKGERKLSFNHWRYVLLHWAFNVKNPDPRHPEETGLPRFLYTHFCPLFHLTNLIALLSPVILLIKAICVVVMAAVWAFSAIPWEKAYFLVGWIKLPEFKASREDRPVVVRKRTAAEERYILVGLLAEWNHGDFTAFWGTQGRAFGALTIEDAEAVFKEYMPRILAARERAKQRKESLRQQLIFWSNFSRVFIKWALYAFYAVLAAVVLYLACISFVPVVSGIWWFCGAVCSFFGNVFTDTGFLSAMLFLGKVLVFLAVLAGAVYGLIRSGLVDRFLAGCHSGLVAISPPFMVVGTFFSWIGSCWNGMLEFVAMFYEENCPPITLVTPEDQKVEDIARGEEAGS